MQRRAARARARVRRLAAQLAQQPGRTRADRARGVLARHLVEPGLRGFVLLRRQRHDRREARLELAVAVAQAAPPGLDEPRRQRRRRELAGSAPRPPRARRGRGARGGARSVSSASRPRASAQRLEHRGQHARVAVLQHRVQDADAHLVARAAERAGERRAHEEDAVGVEARQHEREALAVGARQRAERGGADPGLARRDEADEPLRERAVAAAGERACAAPRAAPRRSARRATRRPRRRRAGRRSPRARAAPASPPSRPRSRASAQRAARARPGP